MKNFYYKGHKIKKKFGQIFIKNIKIIKKIINSINVKKNEILVEIGSGLGALTTKITPIASKIIIIEIDKNLINKIKKNKIIKKNKEKITFIKKDILKINFYNLYKKFNRTKLRIFGNIPYNISIKIIFHLLKYIKIIKDMNLTFQKEIADKLLSKPNNKKYGKLTVIIQSLFKIKKLLDIKNNYFIPKPKVDSTMILLKPKKQKKKTIKIKNILYVTNLLFKHKRKIIKNNNINDFFTNKQLKKLKINIKKMRAENLTIEQFKKLSELIKL